MLKERQPSGTQRRMAQRLHHSDVGASKIQTALDANLKWPIEKRSIYKKHRERLVTLTYLFSQHARRWGCQGEGEGDKHHSACLHPHAAADGNPGAVEFAHYPPGAPSVRDKPSALLSTGDSDDANDLFTRGAYKTKPCHYRETNNR